MYKKPLIVFEGIEGTGKSTQIKNTINYLKKNKYKYVHIREPGGSAQSEKIRKLILNRNNNFHPMTDLFLYMAARNENLIKIINKNYKKKIILVDRFIYSTIAYQHFGMGLNKNLIIKLNKIILKKIKPNFIFYLKVNKKNLIKRLSRRKNKNRYDRFNMKFYQKVQNGFNKILNNKNNVMIINTNDTLINNKNQIIKKIKNIIE